MAKGVEHAVTAKNVDWQKEKLAEVIPSNYPSPYVEGVVPVVGQVWSLTQFYSVDFSQSRIGVKKCVFNKRTIKVCVSCC